MSRHPLMPAGPQRPLVLTNVRWVLVLTTAVCSVPKRQLSPLPASLRAPIRWWRDVGNDMPSSWSGPHCEVLTVR